MKHFKCTLHERTDVATRLIRGKIITNENIMETETFRVIMSNFFLFKVFFAMISILRYICILFGRLRCHDVNTCAIFSRMFYPPFSKYSGMMNGILGFPVNVFFLPFNHEQQRKKYCALHAKTSFIFWPLLLPLRRHY